MTKSLIARRAYLVLIFIICMILSQLATAQKNGTKVFDNSFLHEVRITFEENDFYDILITNYDNNQDGDIPYLMAKVDIDGETVDSVGLRIKGFTSVDTESKKKPLKIDFNEFVKGKRYDGLRKINLNSGFGDPCMQRDFISYHLLRKMGVSAPRTSYTKVYLNEVYWGVYIFIEQVDKAFLKNNFQNSKGNLFKNKGWSNHEWLGDTINNYTPPFVLKTNKETPDWSGFINFTKIINDSINSDFETDIEKVFNTDVFLKALAVDVATNNWDSYLEHGRNWYIYEDQKTGVFNWIPWDYNFSLGGDFPNSGETTEPYEENDDCPIDEPETCQTIISGSTTLASDDPKFIKVISEDCFCCQNEWDELCQDSFDAINIADSSSQTIETSTEGSNPESIFTWKFEIDQSKSNRVLIKNLLSRASIKDKYLSSFCDLMNIAMTEEELFPIIDHNLTLIKEAKKEEIDFIYSYEQFSLDISENNDSKGIKAILRNRIAELKSEIAGLTACTSNETNIAKGDIVINELQAAGNKNVSENHDWIELYNNSNQKVNLSGTFLSDDINNIKKWFIPNNTSLKSKEYLIIWASKEKQSDGLKASFSLNKDGETLIFSNSDGSIIDSISYPAQYTDTTWARIENGIGAFKYASPSFGIENSKFKNTGSEIISSTHKTEEKVVDIFPVPANEAITIRLKDISQANSTILFQDMQGRLIFKQKLTVKENKISVENWNPGIYVVRIKDIKGNESSQKIVVQ